MMTEKMIDDILINTLECIADDLGVAGDVMYDEFGTAGNQIDGVTMQTLDIVLKRQFKRMQEILNECI